MDIIVLWLLVQVTACFPPVNHTAPHGDGRRQHMVKQLSLSFWGVWLGILHSCYASHRKSQVDRFGEVQRDC